MVNQAVFIVGGKGTRLGELTIKTPKPLLKIDGLPFLHYLINEVIRHGIEDIILLTGYKSEAFDRFVTSFNNKSVRLTQIVEPREAGTAGALKFASHILSDRFFLINGDSFFDINLLDLQLSSTEYTAMLGLRHVSDASRFGSVGMLGADIVRFQEKNTKIKPGIVNGGVYVVKKEILNLINYIPCSLENDIFPLLAKKGLLGGKLYNSFFIDIGTPESFSLVQEVLPNYLKRPVLFLDRDGVVNVDSEYPYLPVHIQWIDGAIESIKLANDLGYLVAIVTNQAGVAKGLYAEDDVFRLHKWMQNQFNFYGAHVDIFSYCPHHPDSPLEKYKSICNCRKPKPGLILDILDQGSDPSNSILIGDKHSDIEAARSAGIKSALFRGGNLYQFISPFLTTRVTQTEKYV